MERRWYRIEMNSGPENFFVIGSSIMTEQEMVQALEAGRFVQLDDLIHYNEEGVAKAWSEFDPHCHPRVHLSAKAVVSITPMVGDPRKLQSGPKVLNMPRFLRDDS